MFGLKEIRKEIKRLKEEDGIATVWICHNQDKIKRLDERIKQLELVQGVVPCKGITQKEMIKVVKTIWKKVDKGAYIQSFSYNVDEGLLKYDIMEMPKKVEVKKK